MTIKNAADFWIPCPHQSSTSDNSDAVLPNYHPLAATEVTDIFEFATRSGDIVSYSQAVARLTQGIPGMTCPAPSEGEVADIMTWVEQFMADAARLDFDAARSAPVIALVCVLTAGQL